MSSEPRRKRILGDSTLVRPQVMTAIWQLADKPRLRIAGNWSVDEIAYRIRVGDYRVIYTVSDVVLVVAIESIRHRREAYR